MSPQVYDKNDLAWTSRGDYVVAHNGDIMDTNTDPLRSLYQEVKTRIKSNIGDWKLNQNVGASLGDFVGEPNNKMTAESIKTRIKTSLTKDGFINSKDIKIKYMPVDVDMLMFRVSIEVAKTAKNAGSENLKINVIYNYSENNIYVASGRT